MHTSFSRPSTGARWELDRITEPYGATGKRVRLSISASGVFTVVDALELAEAIIYDAKRAEEINAPDSRSRH
jgi:hypothetical protein